MLVRLDSFFGGTQMSSPSLLLVLDMKWESSIKLKTYSLKLQCDLGQISFLASVSLSVNWDNNSILEKINLDSPQST